MVNLGIIVLAAGQGKRMKSSLPKVLHPLAGKPLLLRVLETARRLQPTRIAVIIGHGGQAVKQACPVDDVAWVVQPEQLGTGHAVLCAKEAFRDFSGDVLILSGDVPLIYESALTAMIDAHRAQLAKLTLLTAFVRYPTGYGRIVRNRAGQLVAVIEERDATTEQKQIPEVNAGFYVAAPEFLFPALEKVNNQNQQREYYLPDVVAIGLRQEVKIATVTVNDRPEIMGVNSREELAVMEKTLQEQINRKWMEAGVTLQDPQSTYIEDEVTIGRDSFIGPNTHLRGRTVIGERCRIDGSAYLTNVEIGDEAHLKFSVVATSCCIGREAIVGPFAHLRPGTLLGARVHVGNFVEAKEATLGEGTKANHLTYLGDVTVGCDTNIGAGTITCNYDGFKKYRTTIGDRVQVGSDSTLVAPVALGDDVYVATATTVRHDVPAGALVFNERQERLREGWTEKKRAQMQGTKK